MKIRWTRWGVLGMLAFTLALGPGCARLGFGGGGDGDPVPADTGTETAAGEPEAALHEVVRARIGREGELDPDRDAELVRARPYWFRELVVYPDGPDAYELELRETTSKTVPYTGHVELRQIRYATRLHRGRADAAQDVDFFRSFGTKYLTYRYANGEWREEGSMFVAERKEEKVGGQWVVVREEDPTPLTSEESEPGWFGRLWQGIFGG